MVEVSCSKLRTNSQYKKVIKSFKIVAKFTLFRNSNRDRSCIQKKSEHFKLGEC
jgi:hypothetical protein